MLKARSWRPFGGEEGTLTPHLPPNHSRRHDVQLFAPFRFLAVITFIQASTLQPSLRGPLKARAVAPDCRHGGRRRYRQGCGDRADLPPRSHIGLGRLRSEYRGSTFGGSLDDVGFIHCSTARQVRQVADLLYRGRHDVVLLKIDPGRLSVPILHEKVGAESFPHIYGPVPKAAVISATPLSAGEDGRLEIGTVG
jgi:uncharacterized protein (DUF952 family)